ncbi:MAG TPA: galactose oxidase-like domain-containing protein, partial [Povalibacter sp.]
MMRRVSCAALFTTFAVFSVSSIHANNIDGAWSQVKPWPLISVHAVMMPDGRVLTYGSDGAGRQTAYFIYDIWDPQDNSHVTLPNTTKTDIFCGSQVVLPQGGSVYLAGGDNWTGTSTTNTGNNNTAIFDYGSRTLTRANNLNRARWYSSSTVLLNGEIYIQGGNGGAGYPEVRDINGNFRLLNTALTTNVAWQYPRNFVAPNGQVFGFDANGYMYYVNPAGTGSIQMLGRLPAGVRSSRSSAAMFRPGRILQFGGASAQAVVIDITGTTPTVTATQPLSSTRVLVNAAILPDGTVLATGGSEVYNTLTGVNNHAEIWDPTSGQWHVGAEGALARLYHSVSLLLQDGSVLVGGGGAAGPLTNLNAEIYYPPYLFDASGARAQRPTILTAPETVDVGAILHFQVGSTDQIARVTMVKTGSVTHSWNMDQRFVELTFEAQGSAISAQTAARAAHVPPGFYHVFAINEAGVPSESKLVRVNIASDLNPAITPSLSPLADRSSPKDVSVQLQLVASDPNEDPLGYSASGLPQGLSLNRSTGLISGTPTKAGSFQVVVSVSDGVNAATDSLRWTIVEQLPLVLEPPENPGPALAGSAVTFSATATNGINTRYRWYFDDGTAATAWSASAAITHTFAAPGIYYVTVTAVDDRGISRSENVVQVVHLST